MTRGLHFPVEAHSWGGSGYPSGQARLLGLLAVPHLHCPCRHLHT